jgi:2-polyprenyl-3-methyl-5-hydroxy-6-metoxy-1,4-benzoquinol methylase
MRTATAAEVEAYRSFLADQWCIRPVKTSEELAEDFKREDALAYRRLAARIFQNDASATPELYSWMATRSRVGPVHSARWCEILTSGMFALWALRAFVNGGRVLDLGCSIGFWAEWAARDGFDVSGIDLEPRLVELGSAMLRSHESPVTLRTADVLDAREGALYDAVVSIQGIALATADYDRVYDAVARKLREGGHAIFVDLTYERSGDVDSALKRAGLGVTAWGLTGGACYPEKWVAIPAVVVQKGVPPRGSMESAVANVEQEWSTRFKPYADSIDGADWARKNTAYAAATGRMVPFTGF